MFVINMGIFSFIVIVCSLGIIVLLNKFILKDDGVEIKNNEQAEDNDYSVYGNSSFIIKTGGYY